MTNVLLLPAFSSQSAFAVVNNADWNDGILFCAPTSPTLPIMLVCSYTAGLPTVNCGATSQLVTGMPIAIAPGIPGGAFVGSILDAANFTMVDVNGIPLNATMTEAAAALTFNPIPLDITGISFRAQVRAMAGGNDVYLDISTNDGTMINGGSDGVLLFKVPALSMMKIDAGSYVMDILAFGDGNTMNLFPQGAAALTVNDGITEVQ
jgi:hypothetical protein